MDHNKVGEVIALMLLGFEKGGIGMGECEIGCRGKKGRVDVSTRRCLDFGIEGLVHEGGRRGRLERIGGGSLRLSESLFVGFKEHRLDRAVYTIVFRWTARVTNSTTENQTIKSRLKGIDQAQQST